MVAQPKDVRSGDPQLDDIDRNHEAYQDKGTVAVGGPVKSLLKG